jgi:glycosyltransferase involved in cell wall biosynthesis
MHKNHKRRISLVHSVLAPGDAISNSLRDKLRALTDTASVRDSVQVKAFVQCSGYEEAVVQCVPTTRELVLDPFFLNSDIRLFEFGIYSELFNAIYCTNASCKTLVHYHNITPRELVSEDRQETIDKSQLQKVNLLSADHVFCDSEFNRQDLLDYGLAPERLSLLPLPVSVGCRWPVKRNPERKDHIVLLYVGRFVPAKGIMDLLQAMKKTVHNGVDAFKLYMVGSLQFSDQTYVGEIENFIERENLKEHVCFVGTVSDEELIARYSAADALIMPSYHEGFCVPVIEAFAHGCYVIAYDSGNLSSIIGGLGTLVKTGDIEGLSQSIEHYCRTKIKAQLDGVEVLLPTPRGLLRESDHQRLACEYALGFSYEAFRSNFLSQLEKFIPAE